MTGLCAALFAGNAAAQAVEWPRYGPDREGVALHGYTNAAPDIVGPVDGSARLTIFTEGNHYPVLLPLVLDGFPAWCASTGRCAISAEDILIVTLPQVMIVAALEGGGLRLGNAVLPLSPDGPVFPDIVMGGAAPLGRLAESGVVAPEAQVFARHRGMGLLARREVPVDKLETFAQTSGRLAIASPNEAGARRQYETTLTELLGEAAAERILEQDIGAFAGRLGIQHRDVPYALLNDLADVGVIFGHLAAFYAETYPHALRYIPVPEAAPFGQDIAAARAVRARPSMLREAFMEYLMASASRTYPENGFHEAARFNYGETIALPGSK